MSTSYLNGAHDFQVQTLNITHQMAVASKAFDHLHDNIAADAIHNSDERCSIPNCYPETRQAVQEEIHGWITDGDDDAEPKEILWLTGPAGAGKTAIAGSIAEVCEDQGILAASFFFSSFAGSKTRRFKKCLIATLAYCLLQHDGLQPLRAPILAAIERDPSVFRKSLSAQCKMLILKPLRDVWQLLTLSMLPKVIIIDGLDEVEAANSRQLEAREARLANEAEQVDILSTLLQAARDPKFPFRILILSRPEPVIREFFSHEAHHLTREVFLDDKYNPDSDIVLYLNAEFTKIRRRYRLPISWPGGGVVDTLRDRASGQFIYAATVIRFLQSARMHPQAMLQGLLHTAAAHVPNGVSPFESLDALYTQILNSSRDPILSIQWLGAMTRLYGSSALFVRQFLQEYHGQAEFLLENFASLITIPPIDDDCSSFEFYHKSLVDFFMDPQRCGPEFHEVFKRGRSNLFLERLDQILRAKGPAVPLAESEWPAFLAPFLDLAGHSDGQHASILISCDLVWWVRRVDDVYRDYEDTSRTTIVNLYQWVHGLCGGPTPHCIPLCKLWRNSIISGCKALGWRVPNALALLRERMRDAAYQGWDREQEAFKLLKPAFIVETFDSPIGRTDAPSRTSPNLPDDDYESMCTLADSLYSRLPSDWLDLYAKELTGGKTPWNALQLEIGRIMDELGVEIEDVDPDAPYPA